jgi:Predicted membrane protein
MRRVLGYLTIWCGATALAISLAWFGVRDVLRAEVDTPYPGVAVAEARTGRPPTPTAAAPPTATPAATPAAATPVSRPERDRPADRPATRPPSAGPVTSRPAATASARPTPSRGPSRTPARRRPTASPKPSTPPAEPDPGSSSDVKVVHVKGGQVSFAIENGECRLLSATPAAGYEARVSGNVGWIRVDLMKGEHGSSVFCTWHGHAPMTDVYEF